MPEDPVRKQRKRDEGQGCAIVLLVGGSLLAGLGLIAEAVIRVTVT